MVKRVLPEAATLPPHVGSRCTPVRSQRDVTPAVCAGVRVCVCVCVDGCVAGQVSRAYSAKDLPGQMTLKVRQQGQGTAHELLFKDLKADLEARERAHFEKKRREKAEADGVARALWSPARMAHAAFSCDWRVTLAPCGVVAVIEDSSQKRLADAGSGGGGGIASKEDEEVQAVAAEFDDSDDDASSDDGGDSDSDSDDDDDEEEAELMRELEKIKKEREEERARKVCTQRVVLAPIRLGAVH